LSSVDNLSVGKLRVEGYLKAADNNIPINENIPSYGFRSS
jgi:LacI family transcriptional regulator